MDWKVIRPFYEMWSESSEYNIESALENEKYEECMNKIREVIGEDLRHNISDNIVDLACEAECEGFGQGFRYGIMFMSGVMKGGATV